MPRVIQLSDVQNTPDHPLLEAAVDFLNERVAATYAANPQNSSYISVDFEDVSWRVGLNGGDLPGELVAQIIKAYESSNLVSCHRDSTHSSKPIFSLRPRKRSR